MTPFDPAKKPTAFIFINGILNIPWMKHSWTDRAAAYVNKNLGADGHVGVVHEYFSGVLLRQIGQRKRAMQLLGKFNQLSRSGYHVVLVGHSNAAAIISYIVTEMEEVVNNVHLIAPASFEKSYEYAIENGNIGGLFIYGSKRDLALAIGARLSQIATLGLSGYGTMGLRGRELEAKHPTAVFDFSNNKMDHGSWFYPENFDDTMRLIMVNEGLMLIGNQSRDSA